MDDVIQERAGVPVLVCDPDGPPIGTTRDALDLIGASFLGAEVVAVPASRLDDDFFSLGTRFAGEVMQKFVNHRLRLAVVGDLSRHLAASSALRALVHESNRADHVWFVPDLDALDERLRALTPPPGPTPGTDEITDSQTG
ncbi:DUF4180 domain-containing protein [Streptoalloteichus tenebrarius]|uniref:DUF4180 domain-containing protein n=1 Tax=Streptoalloteichus tenebrarius (strain ATCC 17920 / DSM 40477 / JCM 4838 / CBS 697.72 / NBRC 16177 / NCIMB 11028 / NRRL B-12390 / A12253. 1 / ISP 5477) TaxID=1933 RepID=UPI0020A31004|nr:DUF4180 domain-containing protein [Streptoalloteichus tenebrarius]BFE99137.1 hypothetical protein GCM10020241_08130 [Streptoalloteichus tenebrarius]